jgi:hypothetical protein
VPSGPRSSHARAAPRPSLLGAVLRQPAHDRRQLLGDLRSLADDVPRLRARRCDLLVRRDLFRLEPIRRGLELRLFLRVRLCLALKTRLLALQASLLLLELFLLRGELPALERQSIRLRRELLLLLSLLLLLFELFLQALCLLLLARVLAARLWRAAEVDRDQRAVVACSEACGHQVLRLTPGCGLRRGAEVLLAQVQGEEGNDQRDQDRKCYADRPPGPRRHDMRPATPEAAFRLLRLRPQECRQAERLDVPPYE